LQLERWLLTQGGFKTMHFLAEGDETIELEIKRGLKRAENSAPATRGLDKNPGSELRKYF